MVAIAICLAGSATMVAQNKATNPFDRESFKNDKPVFAGKYPKADFVEKSNSTLPALRSGNFKQRLDSMVELNSLKWEYSYDANGNPITFVWYYWENNAWARLSKVEYSYDNNGKLTMYIGYIWRDNAWEKGGKCEYSYDNNGKLTIVIYYNWENDAWVKSGKNEYSYDNNGNLTIDIYYNWENNAWIESHKHEYSYNDNGNQTMDIQYDWENNAWKEDSKYKYEYTYNNGKVMSMITYSGKDNTYKTEYGYDNNGNPTMCISYSHSREYDTWEERYKTEYEYDLSVLSSDICSGLDKSPHISTIILEEIKSKNKRIKMKYYKWNENFQIWQDNGVYTFYYSDVQGSNVGIVETWRAASLPRIAGYYSLTGQKLPHEPKQGTYIILYDNGTSEKRVK